MAGPALNQRYQDVLRDIIHNFIESGEPVSSRTVAKLGRQNLSAATIRNVMADLEELGLLRQPHTSAGRVPTKAAYRLYVESLMRWRQLAEAERDHIESSLAEAAAGDIDRLIAVAGHLLSELSHQVGIVLTPSVEEVRLKSADFVSLGGHRVLAVIVSTTGHIDNLVIETEEELSRKELVRISNYVTDHFAGARICEVRDQVLSAMAEERDDLDRWLSQAMTLAHRAVEGHERGVVVEGTNALLLRPELSNIQQARRMLETFADQARLASMLNQCLITDGVRVFLGEDTDVTRDLDFSLVAAPYRVGDQALGNLGVIGPSRMEYQRLVPLVHFLGEALSKALTMVTLE